MSKIVEKLYLGDWNDAQDLEGLQRRNISHILNSAFELYNVFPRMFTYKSIKADDMPSYDMSPYFEEAADWIHNSLQVGTGVFVHCHMGISRSTTLMISYFIKYQGWTFDQALNHIRRLRPIVHPNSGFVKQLKKYEKMYAGQKAAGHGQYGGGNIGNYSIFLFNF